MKKNDGFTLIELIVVILILGIMTGLGTIGFAYYHTLSSKSNLETLGTAFDTARYSTMVSKEGVVELRIENDGTYYYARIFENSIISKEYKIGSSKYTLVLVTDSGTYQIVNNSIMTITFKKSDGSFSTCRLNDIKISLGVSNYIESASSESKLFLALETGRVRLK